MGLTRYKLGDLIKQRREKYDNSVIPVRGVTRDGFIPPKQKVEDLRLYNMFYMDDFVFNPARMEINSIALNKDLEKGACSSLYEIFSIKRFDLVIPDYLNLFIKRDEFARMCAYIGWGSAREYCRVADISELEISLPPIDIQQKYVDIFNAMVANQKCYEDSLEDLKLACDAELEALMSETELDAIGSYIQLTDDRNNGVYSSDDVRGISIEKVFIPTKAKMDGVSVKNYKIVESRDIAYVPVTSRNGGKITIAQNVEDAAYLISSAYTSFRCHEAKPLPEYLMLFFTRPEFDRYARFHSWGSAREVFSWDDMQEVRIPIPDIKTQQALANLFTAYNQRKEINERMKAQIKDICPILIKGSLEEASKA